MQLARLEDDLAREKFRAELRLWDLQHADKHKKISEWIAASTAYLEREEKVDSISSAQLALSQLKAYEADKVDATNSQVNPLKELGHRILSGLCFCAALFGPSVFVLTRQSAAEYKHLTEARCENPDEVKSREAFVDDSWANLSRLSKIKVGDVTRCCFNCVVLHCSSPSWRMIWLVRSSSSCCVNGTSLTSTSTRS